MIRSTVYVTLHELAVCPNPQEKEHVMVKRLFAALLAGAIALPALGQPSSEPAMSIQVGEDLAGIRAALERLVVLREAEAVQTRVDSILRQMDVWLKRLAPIEQKLTIAEDQLRSYENTQRQLGLMQKQQEAARDLDIENGLDSPRSEARRMLADIARSQLANDEKIESVQLRIREHEGERMHLLRRVDSLEATLLDLLDSDS
jgi:hypothetical protein